MSVTFKLQNVDAGELLFTLNDLALVATATGLDFLCEPNVVYVWDRAKLLDVNITLANAIKNYPPEQYPAPPIPSEPWIIPWVWPQPYIMPQLISLQIMVLKALLFRTEIIWV